MGLIGLVIRGRPMVRNLIKAGSSLTFYDDVASVAELVTEGARAASS